MKRGLSMQASVSMKNRLEYKYVVPVSAMADLRADLAPYVTLDPFAAARLNHEYTVRSIYLDSPGLQCYHEKQSGLHNRRKYRIRSYNTPLPEMPVFLEIKRKYNNFVSKTRGCTSLARLQPLLAGLHAPVPVNEEDRRPLESFCYYACLLNLAPRALVVYEREAYGCRFGSPLRITLDKRIRSKHVCTFTALFDDRGVEEQVPGTFVLEVKFFQTLPRWISRVLKRYEITRCACSKYCNAIDLSARNAPGNLRIRRFAHERAAPC